jgi:ubiquitin fusion degradation protein 1
VILHENVLEQLRDAMNGPLLFRITNTETLQSTYCGVLDFTAPHSSVAIIPEWVHLTGRRKSIDIGTQMMRELALRDSQEVRLRPCSLPKGTYVKLRPLHADFDELDDPRQL